MRQKELTSALYIKKNRKSKMLHILVLILKIIGIIIAAILGILVLLVCVNSFRQPIRYGASKGRV